MPIHREAVILLPPVKARCLIGVHPRERLRPRRILLEVEITYDAAQAVAGDDLEAAVDYETLHRDLGRWVEGQSPRLLETLADGACALLCARSRRIRHCRVTARKPGALAGAEVAVRMERLRP